MSLLYLFFLWAILEKVLTFRVDFDRYVSCLFGKDCKTNGGFPVPECPSGPIIYSGFCQESQLNCPGIWYELRFQSQMHFPICKDSKTGCWQLLNSMSGNWECFDPSVTKCPVNDTGVTLKLDGDDWICENTRCPENFAIQRLSRLYDDKEEPYYDCVPYHKYSLCPGDGYYKKENRGYICMSHTCDFVKDGEKYYCPSNSLDCWDPFLTPTTTYSKYKRESVWECARKKEEKVNYFHISFGVFFGIILCVFFISVYFCCQKKRIQNLDKSLMEVAAL